MFKEFKKDEEFGGYKVPIHTQVPNDFLDYTISHDCDLSKLELRIMNLFMRYTFGWHKNEHSVVFTISDIQIILNEKNKNQVINAMKRLCDEKNFLEKKEFSELNEYQQEKINKILGKKIRKTQLLYRLNVADRDPSIDWENVFDAKSRIKDFSERKENFQESKNPVMKENKKGIKIDTDIKGINFDTKKQEIGIKIDTEMSINNDTEMSINNDTDQNAKSLDAIVPKGSLKKGLNKDLNKSIKEISLSNLLSLYLESEFFKKREREIKRLKVSDILSRFETLKITMSEEKFIAILDYMLLYNDKVGDFAQLFRLCEKEIDRENNKRKFPRTGRDLLPIWFKETLEKETVAQSLDGQDIFNKNEDLLNQLELPQSETKQQGKGNVIRSKDELWSLYNAKMLIDSKVQFYLSLSNEEQSLLWPELFLSEQNYILEKLQRRNRA